MRFHLLGAGLLLAALIVWWLFAVALTFMTAACPPDPGNPVGEHLGLALTGAAVTFVPGFWAWRARRRGYFWPAWAALALLAGTGAVSAVVSAHVAGCPFTF